MFKKPQTVGDWAWLASAALVGLVVIADRWTDRNWPFDKRS